MSAPAAVPLFGIGTGTPATDERFTPAWLFRALGEVFDLDPASPVGGGDCVPAVRKLTTEDDGLSAPWSGFVWVNPPFSNATPWADRFLEHGHGLWLGPVSNARWFNELAGRAERVWLMRDFAFTHPTHAGKRTSMPLAMLPLGDRAARAVDRAAGILGPSGGVALVRVTP
jgi:hypothetical protein